MSSGFGSAGQRCSALRILFLQDEIADATVETLLHAMRELSVGDPAALSTDVGPLIDHAAVDGVHTHLARLRAQPGIAVHQSPLPPSLPSSQFVAPALVELASSTQLDREVFGPVLHVVRWRASEFDRLLDDLAASRYALTLGVHSRIDETVERVVARLPNGNVYVNRNIIGAVVGTQPFGGTGLSGTGPKAGGPNYLKRFATEIALRSALDVSPELAEAMTTRTIDVLETLELGL